MDDHQEQESWEQYVQLLGSRLRQTRQKKGLSQENVAKMANISTYTYRKLEAGQSNPGSPANPRLRTLAVLAKVLGTSMSRLLNDETTD